MQKSLYACDEITGLITAAALIRPSRSLDDLTLKSIKKKWKNDRFAAAIDRSEIQMGAEELGVDLWEHVERVLQCAVVLDDEDSGLVGMSLRLRCRLHGAAPLVSE